VRLSPLCTAVAIALLVQGCGSSDSTSASAGGSSSSGTSYTFTLNAILKNSCSVESPFTEIELLLQDDDWTWQETYTPDESGVISFTTSNQNINYTIVAKTQSGDAAEGLEIVSFYQASSDQESVYYATYDEQLNDDSCECMTQNVSLRHRSIETLDEAWSSLTFTGRESSSATETIFKDVTACRVTDEAWPVASFMVKGVDSDNDPLGSADFIDDFSVDGSGQWSVSAVEVAELVSLNNNQQNIGLSQLFQNSEHFYSDIDEDDDTALLFISHLYSSDTYFKGLAENTLTQSSNVYGELSVTSGHQVISTSYSDALDAEAETDMPDIDTVSFSELGDDGTYDYSAVRNYPMAIIKLTYGFTSVPVTWTLYGPEEGTLPYRAALVGYEDIVTADSYISQTLVTLLKSDNASNYDDYIEYYQSLIDSDLDDDIYRYDISINLQ